MNLTDMRLYRRAQPARTGHRRPAGRADRPLERSDDDGDRPARARGYAVERATDQRDRRRVVVELTEASLAACTASTSEHAALSEQLYAYHTAAQMEMLLRFVRGGRELNERRAAEVEQETRAAKPESAPRPRWPDRARALTTRSSSSLKAGSAAIAASSSRRSRCVAIASTSLRRLRRRRSESVPAASMYARCSASVCEQFRDALAVGRAGPDHRNLPARRAGLEREHALDLADHRVGQRMIGLVDDDHVRDLHHPGLQRLDRVARAGHQHEHDGVGVIDDVDLRLPDADGLEQDDVAAGSRPSAAPPAAPPR